MANATNAAKIKLEIEMLRGVATEAYKKIDALTAELKEVQIPPAPPSGTNLSLQVMFEWNPNVYEFLIKSVYGKGYYTTGSMDSNKFFATWHELWSYFNSDEVIWRSPIRGLIASSLAGAQYGGELDRRSKF